MSRSGAPAGPGLAQASVWESGNLGTLKSGNLGSKKTKNKNIKIKILSGQNVGKVWIRRKQILRAPCHAISGHFFHGPKKANHVFVLPISLGGPMGPIHPVWVHMLVSLKRYLPLDAMANVFARGPTGWTSGWPIYARWAMERVEL